MDLGDLRECDEGRRTIILKELQHRDSETIDIFQLLAEKSKKQRFRSIFDFHKSVVADLGEDRSFYTTDVADLLWKCQQWQEELPKVKMFYAVKANPDPMLLRLLVLLGTNFDCATEGEIRAVISAGASPDRIVFANPIITPRGLKYAEKVQVDLMTFDTEEQLHKVRKIHPHARLLIRISPAEVECGFDFSEKFGCSLDESYHLLRTAKELGLNVVGVSFHVGSLNTLETAFSSAIRGSRQVFDYGHSCEFCFSILDIGGGFHGSIGTDASFQKTAQTIRESLNTHFPTEDIQVIAEPGCYVVCSAVSLTTTIISKKINRDQGGGNSSAIKRSYFLNNSTYSSFLPANSQYGIFHEPLLIQKELRQRPSFKSNLFGQTLCSMDVISRDVLFKNMKVGESVIWRNMGAYSLSVNTQFCGFDLPDSRYIFQNNKRLKSCRIKNLEEIIKYLSTFVYVIEEDPY